MVCVSEKHGFDGLPGFEPVHGCLASAFDVFPLFSCLEACCIGVFDIYFPFADCFRRVLLIPTILACFACILLGFIGFDGLMMV